MFTGVKTQEMRKAAGGRWRAEGAHCSSLLAPRRSLGLTLTEVLISMGILTIGLLCVLAMFPAGAHYMQQAEVADIGSAVARSALADAIARGLLNPETWRTYEDNVWTNGAITVPTAERNRFIRQCTTAMRQISASIVGTAQATDAERMAKVRRECGSAFVLDPMGVAAAAVADRATAYNSYTDPFPATGYIENYTHEAWEPWQPALSIERPAWPIRRVTFEQLELPKDDDQEDENDVPIPRQWTASLASSLFSTQDALTLDLPDRADRPPIQNWEATDTNSDDILDMPLARQQRGDYSWIVSIAPPTDAARDALADQGRGFEYNVSVVVFYKRPIAVVDLPTSAQNTDVMAAGEAVQRQERAVRARVVSTGLSGGELLLERVADNVTGALPESPFNGLKVGQWIMLCGPHPASTPIDPRFVVNWYRVVAIEGRDQNLGPDGNVSDIAGQPERRLVSLRGPQWPWQPAANLAAEAIDVPENLSNFLCVGVFPGAVAVHTRTMRLEGESPWSFE